MCMCDDNICLKWSKVWQSTIEGGREFHLLIVSGIKSDQNIVFLPELLRVAYSVTRNQTMAGDPQEYYHENVRFVAFFKIYIHTLRILYIL